MPMNVIIIAVIVLIVLIVLFVIFRERTKKFATGLEAQDTERANFVDDLKGIFGGGQPGSGVTGGSLGECKQDQQCPTFGPTSPCPPG